MIHERRSTLAEYVTELQSKGRIVFDAEEAVETLGTNRGAFLDAAQRLQKRGQLISPRKGFYVVVPPQFASWGAPPRPGTSTRSCGKNSNPTTSVF